MLMELSVQEQKYQAVLAVLSDGRSVSEVAEQWGVSRQSVHAWLRRYEEAGLAGSGAAFDGGRRRVRTRCLGWWRPRSWRCVGRIRGGVRGGSCMSSAGAEPGDAGAVAVGDLPVRWSGPG